MFSWVVRKKPKALMCVKKTLHVHVFVSFVKTRFCQQSATVCTFSGDSPAELSFKSLHNIVLLSIQTRRLMVIHVLKSSSLSFALCFHYMSTRQWLLYKYKKYKKIHFCFMWDFCLKCISSSYWWSVHVRPVSMHTSNPVRVLDGSCDHLFRQKNLNAMNRESKGSIPEVKQPAHS